MKNIFRLLLVTVILSSCTNLDEEFYDKIPGDQYPENALQIALEAAPMYRPLQDFIDNGGWWFCQEVTSDEMTCPTRSTDWDDAGKWRALHQHTWTNTTEAIAAMWGRFYEGIGKINLLLEKYQDAPQTPDLLAIQAQLRIMRAYYYYLLIDNYGDVPYVTLFALAEENPMKDDRAVIFDNIVQEIEDNIGNLKSSTSKTSVTRGMAFSVLSKLYLNAEVYSGTPRWEDAQRVCDSIIDMGVYSLESNPLAPFVTENSSSPENIFTIPYDRDTYKGNNLHMRTLHYAHNLTFDMTVGPWNGFCVMENHFNTYDLTDLRREGFLVGPQYTSSGAVLMDNTAGSPVVLTPNIPALTMDATYTLQEIRMSGARISKFEIAMGASDNLSNDFPLFRYADILLMKAETQIRLGGNGDDLINLIRNRAGLSSISSATLDDLLEERGREMFWEAHRRQDLIRFGKFNNAWWEKAASTSDRKTFPIPQWVIDTNPNLAS
ncbi:MAG: RagB/SusD family nutrient uptake outer membrane protein [Bacteroidales bacterium]|nr:RagB/SusD family nutrient uptake outer membrane protein [Bacteroidales bacterium]MCF8456403.1 RagB/SusD family nutrient uptake outer membrane protein [Bacteroidales bacterium]